MSWKKPESQEVTGYRLTCTLRNKEDALSKDDTDKSPALEEKMDVSDSQTELKKDASNDEKPSKDVADTDASMEESLKDALSTDETIKDPEKTLTEDKAATSDAPEASPKDVTTSNETMEEEPKETETRDTQDNQMKTMILDGADNANGMFDGLEAGMEYTIQIFTVCGDKESKAVVLTACTSKVIHSIRD